MSSTPDNKQQDLHNLEKQDNTVDSMSSSESCKKNFSQRFASAIKKFGVGKFSAIVVAFTVVIATAITLSILLSDYYNKQNERRARHALSHFAIRAKAKDISKDGNISLSFTFTNNSVDDIEFVYGEIHVSSINEDNFYEHKTFIHNLGIVEHDSSADVSCVFSYEDNASYEKFQNTSFNDLKIVFTCMQIKFSSDSYCESYSKDKNDFVVKDFNTNSFEVNYHEK